MTRKTLKVPDFLNEKEINKAIWFYHNVPDGKFARTVAEQIIKPNIERINKTLGQENDPMFLAYCVEFALMKATQ